MGFHLTTQEERQKNFIDKANTVHGGKYDYSLVKFVNCDVKISIKCPVHGIFEQTPASHAFGRGCPKCSLVRTGKSKTIFLQKFFKKHGDFYDYSNVPDTIKASDIIQIGCPNHGIFEQKVEVHYRSGCPKCTGKNKTTEEVIQIFKQIHGDLYDYSKVFYKGAHSKLDIICKKHGVFHQSFSSHRKSHGCPVCANEESQGFYTNKEAAAGKIGHLYLIRLYNEKESFVKIGISSLNSPHIRIKRISKESGYTVDILHTESGDLWDIFCKEQDAHKNFRDSRYLPLNRFDGRFECFYENSVEPITQYLTQNGRLK